MAPDLWTLKRLATTPCTLRVLRARRASGVPRIERLRRQLIEHGVLGVASRVLGSRLIGKREVRRQQDRVDRLLDGEHLRDWWCGSGIAPIDVPYLNHPAARSAIADLEADIVIRVSGGNLMPETFSVARLATLGIHHGRAPRIRGRWGILWGIIEERRDWIGATVHLTDEGTGSGGVLWRGGPQLAPGDTGVELFFRTHLEAVEALVRVIDAYEAGAGPPVLRSDDAEPSAYRSSPGLGAWCRYLRQRRGRRAAVTLERALKP